MRLRHVKMANNIIEASPYIVLDPFSYCSKWKELFGNDNPIHVEIGMGKGKFIIEKAINNPDINFIGIEKFDSVIVRALQKVNDKEIVNLKFIREDAFNVDKLFNKEVERIYLNFSDPWPKKRHEKRRLTSYSFLQKYDIIFKDKKYIHFKTDNRHLFEYSLISVTDYGYKIDSLSLDLHDDNLEDNVTTEYEEKFHKKGYPIYKMEISRN